MVLVGMRILVLKFLMEMLKENWDMVGFVKN